MTLITSWPNFDDVQNSSWILEKPSPASSSFAPISTSAHPSCSTLESASQIVQRVPTPCEAQALRVRIQTHETLQTKDAARKLVEYFTELRLVDRCGGTEDAGSKASSVVAFFHAEQ